MEREKGMMQANMKNSLVHKEFMGVVARVEGLQGSNSPFEAREAGRQASCRVYRDINGLFESFGGGSSHEYWIGSL